MLETIYIGIKDFLVPFTNGTDVVMCDFNKLTISILSKEWEFEFSLPTRSDVEDVMDEIATFINSRFSKFKTLDNKILFIPGEYINDYTSCEY